MWNASMSDRKLSLHMFSGSKDCEEGKRVRRCFLEREVEPTVSQFLGAQGFPQQVSDTEVQREEANASSSPGHNPEDVWYRGNLKFIFSSCVGQSGVNHRAY